MSNDTSVLKTIESCVFFYLIFLTSLQNPLKKMKKSNKLIFLIGRDQWQKDDVLNQILVTYFKKNGCQIEWEDPAGNIIYHCRKFGLHFKNSANFLRIISIRCIQIVYGLFHWNYFIFLSNSFMACIV